MNLFKKYRRINIDKTVLITYLPFVAVAGIFFFLNTFHEAYPDEFDNISGGWFILNGKLIYKSFFTHHGPFPYFLASFITLFSRQSFVLFRIIYALFLLCSVFGIYWYLRKSVGYIQTKFYLFFIVFLGLMGTYYWIQMLLADNIAAFTFTPVFALLLLKSYYSLKLTRNDILFMSILCAIGIYSSLTFTYVYALIILFSVFLYSFEFLVKRKYLMFIRNSLKVIGIFLIPHAVYLVYLLVTGSLSDYIFQGIQFNTKYYIYNYPRATESSFINPVRFAIIIAYDFFLNFHTLFLGVLTFGFSFPVNMTMAVGNVALFLYLLFKRRYLLAFFVLLMLIYSNARSNVLNSKETDYQSAVYIFISFINIFFVLQELYKSMNATLEYSKKILFTLLFVILSIYFFFCTFYFIRTFTDKYFPKYMGKAPLIYNRPYVAPIMNLVLDKKDYAWIGPFSFEELFYLDVPFPSKYQILIPGMGKSQKVQQEMIANFEENKPKMVYFNTEFNILGSETKKYGYFFIKYLDKNYVNVMSYRNGDIRYASLIPANSALDIDKNMYLRKDIADDLLRKLESLGYVEKKRD